ncbi:ATP-dependent zinc metalloprotease FtsH [Zymobacter sp. IVIA_5232.4 C2]|uniref:ATP-dependent zinc metalloprotease FtsH n=1 Tax=Zymobacter sp. IVIA_5232.4 C2 TaxID=3394855 RepID=UPI0039C0413E
MNDTTKNLSLWLIIAVVLLLVFNNFSVDSAPPAVSYSDFVHNVQDDKVKSVTIDGYVIHGKQQDDTSFQTIRPSVGDDPQLINQMLHHDIKIDVREPQQPSIWKSLLISAFPILLTLGVFFFFMRQMQGGAGGKGGPMSFGKSKARLLSQDQINTTLKDVAGCDDAKAEVAELVDFLRDPGKYQRLGGKIPRGILMVGPPGTGKTLLAKAIAGEAKVPFFTISGSDFVEMFVGVGASRVRDMFEQAKKSAPCIIFIDEIDAVGRARGGSMSGGGHDEREQTLNQLLVEMDGFEKNDGTIVIAATNRPDVLDKALLRPGRFDRQVTVDLPDFKGREQILNVHLAKVPCADDIDVTKLARGTPGFSGAQLANLVNEAALFAARRNLRLVGMKELDDARDKLIMGLERRSLMTDKEKFSTAYHEAGHAIVSLHVPEYDPIYKVSIMPRSGGSLGVTMFLPEEAYSESRRKMVSRICVAMGGRAAEEILHGPEGVTSGAYGDIQQITQVVYNMLSRYGLSDKLGMLLYDDPQNQYMDSQGAKRFMSEETRQLLDREARRIIDECYQETTRILVEHKDKLDLMAKALVEYETLDSDQVAEIMEGRFPSPPKSTGGGTPPNGGQVIDGTATPVNGGGDVQPPPSEPGDNVRDERSNDDPQDPRS